MCYQGKIDLKLMMLVVTKQGDNLDFEVYHQLMVQSGDVTRFAEEAKDAKVCNTFWPTATNELEAWACRYYWCCRTFCESYVFFGRGWSFGFQRPQLTFKQNSPHANILMIWFSNFYQYYHLANHSNDISHVSQCLVIPQFVLLRIVVNIPLVTIGRLAGVPLGTK